MALFNIKKLKIFTFTLLSIIFLLFIVFDRYLIKKRAEFVTEKIDIYKVIYKKIPKDIDFISQEKDLKRESLCTFFNETIPGWGYCYYATFGNRYVFFIKGYFSTILYESDENIFLYNSPKYD